MFGDPAPPKGKARESWAAATTNTRGRDEAAARGAGRVGGGSNGTIEALQAALNGDGPVIPDTIDDRGADMVEPLVAIADLAGGKWPRQARKDLAAVRGAEGGADDSEGDGEQLLRALWEIRNQAVDAAATLGKEADERILTIDLLVALVDREAEPWPGLWGREVDEAIQATKAAMGKDTKHGIARKAAMGLARLLREFGVTSCDVWDGGRARKGYRWASFDDAFSRYLDPPPVGGGGDDEPEPVEAPVEEGANGGETASRAASPVERDGPKSLADEEPPEPSSEPSPDPPFPTSDTQGREVARPLVSQGFEPLATASLGHLEQTGREGHKALSPNDSRDLATSDAKWPNGRPLGAPSEAPEYAPEPSPELAADAATGTVADDDWLTE